MEPLKNEHFSQLFNTYQWARFLSSGSTELVEMLPFFKGLALMIVSGYPDSMIVLQKAFKSPLTECRRFFHYF